MPPGRDNPKPYKTLHEVFAEPDLHEEWLVEGLLPRVGFSLVAAKAKVGKSTLARNLTLCTATGEPFLGRTTLQGPVFYFALENDKHRFKHYFQVMGAQGSEPIYIFDGSAMSANGSLIRILDETRPVLVVIDTLFKFFPMVKDINSYTQVNTALTPLVELCRAHCTHFMAIHHASKYTAGDAGNIGDAVCGSTTIFANVDTLILMRRNEKYRTVQSDQRFGTSMAETILRYDDKTDTIRLGEGREEEDIRSIGKSMLQYISLQKNPPTEKDIDDGLEGRHVYKVRVLRSLVDEGLVIRQGRGGKTDPYRYQVCENTSTTGTTKIGSIGINCNNNKLPFKIPAELGNKNEPLDPAEQQNNNVQGL